MQLVQIALLCFAAASTSRGGQDSLTIALYNYADLPQEVEEREPQLVPV